SGAVLCRDLCIRNGAFRGLERAVRRCPKIEKAIPDGRWHWRGRRAGNEASAGNRFVPRVVAIHNAQDLTFGRVASRDLEAHSRSQIAQADVVTHAVGGAPILHRVDRVDSLRAANHTERILRGLYSGSGILGVTGNYKSKSSHKKAQESQEVIL